MEPRDEAKSGDPWDMQTAVLCIKVKVQYAIMQSISYFYPPISIVSAEIVEASNEHHLPGARLKNPMARVLKVAFRKCEPVHQQWMNKRMHVT